MVPRVVKKTLCKGEKMLEVDVGGVKQGLEHVQPGVCLCQGDVL